MIAILTGIFTVAAIAAVIVALADYRRLDRQQTCYNQKRNATNEHH